jgi:protein-L-isoaspartate(D-aspartate) O-methyltransferase
MHRHPSRRSLLAFAAAAATAAFAEARPVRANQLGGCGPPTNDRADFINWMQANRGEEPIFLSQRWERFAALRASGALPYARDARAFLLTPREDFVLRRDRERAYDSAALDLGFGATISAPYIVARMTAALGVERGDKVLEIGTGSGYQSAYLAQLTDRVWTLEVVSDLLARTQGVYDVLAERGYAEYKSIKPRAADGYFGWAEAAPFDKIILTCGVEQIPPQLLAQLRPGGVMVIPLGPRGAQRVIRVIKDESPNGHVTLKRFDILAGRAVQFIPLRRLEGAADAV